jgi:uncharacterized RDD family membrane protein YckC
LFQVNEVLNYAGFWRRVGAALADAALMGAASSLWLLADVVIVRQSGPLLANYMSCAGLAVFFFGAFECIFVFCPEFAFAFHIVYQFGPGTGTYCVFSWWEFVSILLSMLPFATVNWLYHAIMESSVKQATLGKMLLRIQVTDLSGQRITFWRATARHFSKLVSAFLFFIGYMMPGWTTKKQALHDKLSSCLVVKKGSTQLI